MAATATTKTTANPARNTSASREERNAAPDPLRFVLQRPMATPAEMGAAFDQFIGAAADLAAVTVSRQITAGLSGVTISWDKRTVPSREWLRGLEEEIVAFGACNGLHVWFRRH